jgi:hypothetical protein
MKQEIQGQLGLDEARIDITKALTGNRWVGFSPQFALKDDKDIKNMRQAVTLFIRINQSEEKVRKGKARRRVYQNRKRG